MRFINALNVVATLLVLNRWGKHFLGIWYDSSAAGVISHV